MIARPLTTKSGENTSAVWGITNGLLRLYENYHPEYIGWVHDRGVSFRQEQYPEYKATREKLSEELQQVFDRSLERVCQILDAFHIPVIAINGYEADDVVATLAERAAHDGLQAVIVSGDKDFYQLIGAGIALLNPGRGGQAAVEEQWVDESNASERLGVPPERVVDYLALVGDTSDNIPGVKGIGDKTAVQLLETYGDLDTILTKAPEIPGKRPREALLQQADNARLSRQLVTLRRDVPVELDLEQLRVRTPDTDTLATLFTELEFRTLIPKLGDLASVGAAPAPAPAAPASPASAPAAAGEPGAATRPAPAGRAPLLADPTIVDEAAGLAPMIQELRGARLVALQTEPGLAGISFAVSPGRSWYLPFGHVARDGEFDATPPRNMPSLASEALAPLRALLADPTVRKAGHDIKAAWVALTRAGLSLAGVAYDSMVASFVLDPGNRSHAIHDLAREHLSVELPTTAQLLGKGKGGAPERTFAQVPPAEAARVSAAQAEMVLRLEAAGAKAHEDRRLDGCRGARAARRDGTRSPAAADRIPRAVQAAVDVCGCPAGIHQHANRPRAHELQSNRCSDRAAVFIQSESAKHPRAHAARRRNPARVRRTARSPAAHRRLFAGRVAAARAFVGRPGVRGGVPARRRYPPADRRRHLWRPRRTRHRRDARPREDDQLRHDLRSRRDGVVAPVGDHTRGGQGLHQALLRALRRRPRVVGSDHR